MLNVVPPLRIEVPPKEPPGVLMLWNVVPPTLVELPLKEPPGVLMLWNVVPPTLVELPLKNCAEAGVGAEINDPPTTAAKAIVEKSFI